MHGSVHRQPCPFRAITVALIAISLMYFIGGSYSLIGPAIGGPIKYASTWLYCNTAQFFGAGIFDNFFRDVPVLGGVNFGLICASLFIFRKRDIPV